MTDWKKARITAGIKKQLEENSHAAGTCYEYRLKDTFCVIGEFFGWTVQRRKLYVSGEWETIGFLEDPETNNGYIIRK